MGGGNTEVSDETTNVLLEAANFEPLMVLRSGERHRMRTESQTRWEKGVDPETGRPGGDVRVTAARRGPQARAWTGEGEVRGEIPLPPVIAFRPGYTNVVLGMKVRRRRTARPARTGSASASTTHWTRAHADVAATRRAPGHRRRRRGGAFPARARSGDAPRPAGDVGRLKHEQRLRRQVEDALVGAGTVRGLHLFAAGRPPWTRTPSSCPCRSARSSACSAQRWPSACSERRTHNIDMGNTDIALFEVAHVYLPPGPVPDERWRLGGIVQGDFFKTKGIVEAVFAALAHRADVRTRRSCARNSLSARPCSRVGSGRTARSSWTASGARSSSTWRSCSPRCPNGSSIAT